MRTTVIGKSSLLARILSQNPATVGWRFLSHTEALSLPTWLNDTDCIVNFAFDSRLASEPYNELFDFDLQLAQIARRYHCRYIMMSSRMVYGTPAVGLLLTETMPLKPMTLYGRAKRETEFRLLDLLGDRVSILRLSNIFAAEERIGERRTFFGLALRRLMTEGCIEYDISPFVERDFLAARVFAERLVQIVAHPFPGTFNMGGGCPVAVGRIAQWLIGGRGAGRLIVTDFREHDAFYLDMARVQQTWNFPTFCIDDLRTECVAVGRNLAAASL